MSEPEPPARWNAGTVYEDMWVDPDNDPRDVDGVLEGERATLLDYLRVYRLTLRMKCDGLTPEQLARRSVPPSTMSLLGLVRHLAEVERSWSRRIMAADDAPALYGSGDADFDGAVDDADIVDSSFADWQREMDNTDTFVAGIEDLSTMSLSTTHDPIALREVLIHLIEEYARHCGHADLLRERIDGRTGQ